MRLRFNPVVGIVRAEESLICETLLATCVRGGSKWGQVITYGRFHSDRIEQKEDVDCARAETAARYLRAEEVAKARVVAAAIAWHSPAVYVSMWTSAVTPPPTPILPMAPPSVLLLSWMTQ
jgi:hypothetical protein